MPVPALAAPTAARTPRLAPRLARRLAVNALVLALAALLLVDQQPVAPRSTPTPTVAPEIVPVASTATKVRRALSIARNQVGDPYRYGAAGPNAFDCSGLIYFSTHRAGFRHVPRTSRSQARFMRKIRRSAMRPGDFVFFRNGGGVYHAGIFTGWSNGRRQILHAPSTGSRVRRDRIWTDSWFPGTLRGR